MPQLHRSLFVTLAALTLSACSAGGAEDAPMDEAGAQSGVQGSEVRACDLVNLQAATQVLGTGTEHPGGDTEAMTCMYVNPGVGMLSVQLATAEYYDQVTIMQPHTAAQVGDRGRSNVQPNGVVAVQFVRGSHSLTLNVQPLGASQVDYLPPLLTAARDAAGRLP